ncbi:lipid II:glycine glycyltransferase (peptidoglycan interpeptide bridge formation enzyme) [Streptomyces sp. KhCrAH-43]|uniref:lipid II:glycine glycyltransferase FemX n=1 Tax=unclassified Streptomyces TaxID=2593676 RepID=UPI00037A69E5|nr:MULTISPECIES: peptidoglycan bridge formation glycyltransferase FemA/FemB family protein [unclassified Streptomyces]MYS35573.1 peptidoglycan bridge formation glycyltransferase FemA/FemB family protein [Streptomyces sp. SID4920]MYX68650.1 peptidoglycan bridge formation glycyltransferase FemA/FemB family protein [Streptomyces sp. SID8373]RAJ55123.1 lipid II:glycine glycyltransferase (peptidoglycan interpeptide bridge formation enzyme) [Streptomyces sp. KhCrAH-43]
MSALLATGDRSRERDLRIHGLTADEHRAHLATRAEAGFLQYPSWAAVKEGWSSERLGWREDGGELSGSALVLYRQFPGTRKYFAYLPEGPVADWADPDMDRWLRPLLAHLRAAGAFAVRMGPSPAYRRWDGARLKAATGPGRTVGDVLASEVDPLGAAVADRLRARGWRRCGGDGDDADAQPRYVFRVPLAGRTAEDLWSGLNQEWRRNVRRARKAGVRIVTGSAAELPEFHRLLRITEERDGFRLGRSLAYYQRQYAALNAEAPGRMKLCLAVHDGEILAAHTMISTGRRVWYQTGASADHRREVRPSNALQWRMMCDARDAGAEVYDMRGVSSTLDPGDRPFGLLRWKLGTGGQVVETLGEWETSVGGAANNALYRAFQAYLARR